MQNKLHKASKRIVSTKAFIFTKQTDSKLLKKICDTEGIASTRIYFTQKLLHFLKEGFGMILYRS